MKVVIVGAIAGGATVASQIRRSVPTAEIMLIGKEEQIGYGTCGLPYAIGQIVEDLHKLSGPSPQKFSERKNIDLYTSHEVVCIHRDTQTIIVQNLKTNEQFEAHYDKLILSTGTSSNRPHFPGMNSIPFFTLKTYEDMEVLKHFIDVNQPKSCAVVGGGFIAIELIENFIHRGIQTTVILRSKRIMRNMDENMSHMLMVEMERHGVQFILEDEIHEIDGHVLTLTSGKQLKVDFLSASIGTKPNTKLAEDAQLPIGKTLGIIVNPYMQTQDPNIYAIGDIAEVRHWITNEPTRIELAWHAHRQAFIVAQHLANQPISLNPILGTFITKLFDFTAGMTGLSEHELIDKGYQFNTVEFSGKTNAGYYPDVGSLTLRVHYEKGTRRILGAQAVGTKGVDKRIDVIATAIIGHQRVDDLAALELSYSPPYSSPKDPVNMIGYKAMQQAET